MDDVRRELAALRARMRLQMIASVGALVVLVFAMGGADAVARTMVDVDSWKIRTKNLAGALTDRIVATTGEDQTRVKLVAAHLELAQQATAPVTPAAGAIWYDSASHRLKYRNNTAWVEATPLHIRKAADESVASSTTLQDDNELFFSVGASEKWSVDLWVLASCTSATPDIKVAFQAPTGATSVDHWGDVAATGSNPNSATITAYASGSDTTFPCGLPNGTASFHLHLRLVNSTTAGTVKFRWAQNASNAAAVVVKAGSTLVATRIQ